MHCYNQKCVSTITRSFDDVNNISSFFTLVVVIQWVSYIFIISSSLTSFSMDGFWLISLASLALRLVLETYRASLLLNFKPVPRLIFRLRYIAWKFTRALLIGPLALQPNAWIPWHMQQMWRIYSYIHLKLRIYRKLPVVFALQPQVNLLGCLHTQLENLCKYCTLTCHLN